MSITPATDLNDVHHLPGSGLIMTANEGIKMGTYYVPQLGPAPKWASFLENVTEEMEDQVTRSVYEDYKFVEKSELKAYVLCMFLLILANLLQSRVGSSRWQRGAQAVHARLLRCTQVVRSC